jgi:hypothetical protein
MAFQKNAFQNVITSSSHIKGFQVIGTPSGPPPPNTYDLTFSLPDPPIFLGEDTISWIHFAQIATPPGPLVYDFPLPRQPARPVDLLTWLSVTQQIPMPPPVFDWPTPTPALPATDLFFNIVEKLSLYALAQTPPLSTNYDWPLPIAPQRASDLLNLAQNIVAVYLPVAPPPAGNNYDWPLPYPVRIEHSLHAIATNNPALIPPFVPTVTTTVAFNPFLASVGRLKTIT